MMFTAWLKQFIFNLSTFCRTKSLLSSMNFWRYLCQWATILMLIKICIFDDASENMVEDNNNIEDEFCPKITLKVPRKGQCLWPNLHYAMPRGVWNWTSSKVWAFSFLFNRPAWLTICFLKVCFCCFSIYICRYISKMDLFLHILMP